MFKRLFQTFKIIISFFPYKPQTNGAMEAANNNIKVILEKMIKGQRKLAKKLLFTL